MNLTCHDLQNLKFKNEQSVEITGYNSGRAISTTLRKGSVLDKLIEHTDVALHFGSENDLLVIGIVTKVHNAQLEVQISNGMKLAIGLGASQRADAQAKAQSQQFLQSWGFGGGSDTIRLFLAPRNWKKDTWFRDP